MKSLEEVNTRRTLNSIERQLCDIQGRLFELALNKGYNCKEFIEKFMNSQTAAFLDQSYDRLQWAGEEYILANLDDEVGGLKKDDNKYPREVMYWVGYVYRYWHYLTEETSKEIYTQANESTMDELYLGLHTIDVVLAVLNLKELYIQKTDKN